MVDLTNTTTDIGKQVDTTNIGKEVTIDNTTTNNIKIDPTQQKLLTPTWVGMYREVLAYVFGIVILYDFCLAPTFVQIADTFFKVALPPWVPLTTTGGGLFYVAMAAILGISSWGKMQESRELIRNMPDFSNGPPH